MRFKTIDERIKDKLCSGLYKFLNERRKLIMQWGLQYVLRLYAEHIGLKGIWNIDVYDGSRYPTHKSTLEHDAKPLFSPVVNKHNLNTNAGLQYVLDLMIGDESTKYGFFGVGSGTTAADGSDTALETQLENPQAVDDDYRSGMIGKWDTFCNTTEQNGDWREVCICTAATSYTMLNHYMLSVAERFTKANTETVTAKCQETIADA